MPKLRKVSIATKLRGNNSLGVDYHSLQQERKGSKRKHLGPRINSQLSVTFIGKNTLLSQNNVCSFCDATSGESEGKRLSTSERVITGTVASQVGHRQPRGKPRDKGFLI